ncbi:MAG: thermonuclease family protein [Raoultibacter sp.]
MIYKGKGKWIGLSAVLTVVIILVSVLPSESSPLPGIEVVTVTHVVDGDTLDVVSSNGQSRTVRLIGVDTPESVHPDATRNTNEGIEASEYTKSLVAVGQEVYLTSDVSDVDRYGRLLRYVWLSQPSEDPSEDEASSIMLNAQLVSDGYAQPKRYPPDTAWAELLERLGASALDAGLGISDKF